MLGVCVDLFAVLLSIVNVSYEMLMSLIAYLR